METTEPTLNLKLEEFPDEGLYLIFSDSHRVALTKDRIAQLAQAYWEDPEKIPPQVKKAADFQLCNHCPEKGKDILCCALRPLLPYLEEVDKYMSYDKVTAVYREEKSPILHVSYTSMQEALKYLSFLSLSSYCKMGQRYHRFFEGVIPLMDVQSIASRVYLNVYLEYKGDVEKIKKETARFKEEILESTKCMVKRLHLLCSHDAFLNAFINAELVTEFVDLIDNEIG